MRHRAALVAAIVALVLAASAWSAHVASADVAGPWRSPAKPATSSVVPTVPAPTPAAPPSSGLNPLLSAAAVLVAVVGVFSVLALTRVAAKSRAGAKDGADTSPRGPGELP